jgi:hypothetical protein
LMVAVAFVFLSIPSSAAAEYAPVDAPGPTLTVPQARLAASLTCTPDVQNATVEPVLLLPATGVNSQDNFSWNYEKALAMQGIPYCTSDQQGEGNSNLSDIQIRGEYVTYAIRQVAAMAGRPIAVAGHSQGGMVMRWSLRFWPDTRPLVADVIGFAGSNHGTTGTALACAAACPAADWQQGSESNFTKALNSGQETFAGIAYTEVYTHLDEVVMPNADETGSSSVHGPGEIANVAVQEICPLDTSEHLQIGTSDPVAWDLFLDAITHPGPADPARIDASVCLEHFMPGIDPLTYAVDAGKAAADLELNTETAPKIGAEPPLFCYVTASCPPASTSSAGASAPPGSAPTSTGAAKLKILVRPRRVAAGEPTSLKVTVKAKVGGRMAPVPGATVRLAGKRGKTTSQGSVRLEVTLGKGAHVVRASKSGFKPGKVRLRARR